MKALLLSVLWTTFLWSVSLKEYTLYDKPDRIDLMLTFDAPWPGKITRTQKEKREMLMLKDVTFPRQEEVRKPDSPFLGELRIAPLKDATLIALQAKVPLKINASKTIDNTGLRIRIEPASGAEEATLRPIPQKKNASRSTDGTSDISWAFGKVVFVLLLLTALLWFLKRWIEKRSGATWLFGERGAATEDIRILAQKPLDMRNRIVLIGYGEKKYLVLTGENALLLDRFEEDEAAFETLLQKHGKKLGDFLENQ